MRKSRLSQQKQTKLIEHFIAGTIARCAAEIVDVNRNTAIFYYHRLRVGNRRVVYTSVLK